MDLESEWRKDAARFLSASAPDIFSDLIARHSETHRRYHGPGHLAALFELLSLHAPHLGPGSTGRLAVWWHDAVYEPARKDNEEKSSDLARRHLAQLGLHAGLREQVCALIEATKNHWDSPGMGDGDYFLDADIAILGAPADRYDIYAAGVREEYSWAPDPAYRAGRTAFLNGALARTRLFRTDVFEDAYGQRARANLHRELFALNGAS